MSTAPDRSAPVRSDLTLEHVPDNLSRPSWQALVVVAAASVLVGAAIGFGIHGTPAAPPPATPPAVVVVVSPAPPFAPGQQVRCGRLDGNRCAEVLGVLEARVPGTRQSPLAVVDYAAYVGPDETLSPRSTQIYLVAFAPWPGSDAVPMWPPAPTWRVSNLDGTWEIFAQASQGQLPGCFMLLLRDAGLEPDPWNPPPSGPCP